MIITKSNLNDVLFENHDARLLIEEVVTNTSANLYYYHEVEISVKMAIDIYNRAHKADEEESFYSVSFLHYSGAHAHAFDKETEMAPTLVS